MKPYFRSMLALFVLLLVAACSPVRTGVIDGTLATNLRPGLTVAPGERLAFVSGGRVWPTAKTGDVGPMNVVAFDYALYADPEVSPASKFAYAAFARIEEKGMWMFVPQGQALPGQLGKATRVFDEREGRLYTLHIPAQGDWASAVLAENGHTPPEAWVAKRWVFSLEGASRAMAEYREPWPDDLDVPDGGLSLLTSRQENFLRDFTKRALAAFAFGSGLGDFDGVPAARPVWKMPATEPNITRLVGDVMRVMDDGKNNFADAD